MITKNKLYIVIGLMVFLMFLYFTLINTIDKQALYLTSITPLLVYDEFVKLCYETKTNILLVILVIFPTASFRTSLSFDIALS